MRNKRNVQINVCLTQEEVKRLRQRAKKETEGNVSRLVREALFPTAPAYALRHIESVTRGIGSDAEYNPSHDHSMMCDAREGGACTCGAFEVEMGEQMDAVSNAEQGVSNG